jgi:hypothetical protein
MRINEQKPGIKTLWKNSFEVFLLLVFFIIFVLGFYLRLESLNYPIINDWITRDFDRALNIRDGTYFPLAGPELTNGGRLPGPFLYFILAFPLFFHYSYDAIFIFNFILNIGSIAVLFFVLRKYFNLQIAVISSSLLSVDLYHIGATNFPMNPSFLFLPFIFFLWALLEFCIKNNLKAFILSFVILFIGIQIHYQIAIYFLVPLFLALIYKIKIPIKTIVFILFAAAICFTPYLIYKSKTFIPETPGVRVTQPIFEDFSTEKLFKIVTIQNTLFNLTNGKRFDTSQPMPEKIGKIHYWILSAIVYYFLIYSFLNLRKKGVQNCHKEIIVTIMFFLPALLYEIISPTRGHYWYRYIFIVPQSVLTGLVATYLLNSTNKGFRKFGLSAIVFAFLAISAILAFKFTYKTISSIQKPLMNISGSSGSFSYKNSNFLLKTLMDKLELSPNTFFNQVYFNDFHISSLRRLEFASGNLTNKKTKTKIKKNNICYFISEPIKSKRSIMHSRIADKVLLQDKSIDIVKSFLIKFNHLGFNNVFQIRTYIPKNKQSCYNNGFNPFVSTKNIRNLLREARDINIDLGRVGVQLKEISVEEKYDSNSELISFDGNYIIQNSYTQSPFKLKVLLKKQKNNYSLKVEIVSYYFYGSPNMNMRTLDIFISPEISDNISVRLKKSPAFNILPRKSLITYDGANILIGNTYWNYNQTWFKEISLPSNIKFFKNQYYLDLSWEIFMMSDDLTSQLSQVLQRNALSLKKPEKIPN